MNREEKNFEINRFDSWLTESRWWWKRLKNYLMKRSKNTIIPCLNPSCNRTFGSSLSMKRMTNTTKNFSTFEFFLWRARFWCIKYHCCQWIVSFWVGVASICGGFMLNFQYPVKKNTTKSLATLSNYIQESKRDFIFLTHIMFLSHVIRVAENWSGTMVRTNANHG